ncbi:unnamed protein product [Caenorhabditis auriculariae]|uniref:Uncharacterized protein n=1 Tax=Caenorhabditis auriculariae TaxID=2777116 RepID=A0A8S1HIS8_9PELO|nr:unnamed protein product [Caenorhabditis auriculariae]
MNCTERLEVKSAYDFLQYTFVLFVLNTSIGIPIAISIYYLFLGSYKECIEALHQRLGLSRAIWIMRALFPLILFGAGVIYYKLTDMPRKLIFEDKKPPCKSAFNFLLFVFTHAPSMLAVSKLVDAAWEKMKPSVNPV